MRAGRGEPDHDVDALMANDFTERDERQQRRDQRDLIDVDDPDHVAMAPVNRRGGSEE